MPIGPSHGSRGGRSSFGGGSSSSGSSRRSSGSNLGGAILGGIIYSMFANRRRRRYEDSGDGENQLPYRPRPTKYLVFAIIFAIFAAVTMIFRSALVSTQKSYQNTLDIMRTDYTESYKPLIDAVKNYDIDPSLGYVDCGNGQYKTIASFRGSNGKVNTHNSYPDNPQSVGAYLDFQEDGVSYYFIVYEYYDVVKGETVKGTTYSQFSASQYQNMNGEIEIAYFSKAGQESFSINTNYTSLETAEYKYYEDVVESNKSAANIFLIVFIVELAVVALFVFLFVKKLKKYKALVKQDEELFLQKRQAEADKAQAEAEGAQIEAQRKNRFCQYCGSQIDENTNACSSCGAKFSNDN